MSVASNVSLLSPLGIAIRNWRWKGRRWNDERRKQGGWIWLVRRLPFPWRMTFKFLYFLTREIMKQEERELRWRRVELKKKNLTSSRTCRLPPPTTTNKVFASSTTKWLYFTFRLTILWAAPKNRENFKSWVYPIMISRRQFPRFNPLLIRFPPREIK